MAKETNVVNENLPKEADVSIGEIGKGSGIEKISETDYVGKSKLAAFMEELLTIKVHQKSEKGVFEFVNPAVNGINQPIFRDVEVKVKRKYVEALARARVTTYEQITPDPSKPANIQMRPKTVICDPFTVIYDPSGKKGKEWLLSITQQAN